MRQLVDSSPTTIGWLRKIRSVIESTDALLTYPGNNCPKGDYRDQTEKVGGFQPNAWGIYDMHGNVWEWIQDWYGDYSSNSEADPKGPDKGEMRVLRGGSWFNKAGNLRSAYRFRNIPDFRGNNIGFRVSRDF